MRRIMNFQKLIGLKFLFISYHFYLFYCLSQKSGGLEFFSVSAYSDLLIWVIKLKRSFIYVNNNDSSVIDNFIENIAYNLSLVVHGKLFDDVYILMHPFHLQSKWLLRDLNFKQSLLHDDKYPQSEYQMTHHKQQIDVIKKLQSILGTEKWNSTRILMYKKLSQIKELEWFKQQIVRPRQKRSVIYFSDPFFDQQWHLVSLSIVYTLFIYR